MGVWIETNIPCDTTAQLKVTPYVGVWIETSIEKLIKRNSEVTPYVGVWIETTYSVCILIPKESLLMWECGLKHLWIRGWRYINRVTPYVGVWIETNIPCDTTAQLKVTPYVGVWIETSR